MLLVYYAQNLTYIFMNIALKEQLQISYLRGIGFRLFL